MSHSKSRVGVPQKHGLRIPDLSYDSRRRRLLRTSVNFPFLPLIVPLPFHFSSPLPSPHPFFISILPSGHVERRRHSVFVTVTETNWLEAIWCRWRSLAEWQPLRVLYIACCSLGTLSYYPAPLLRHASREVLAHHYNLASYAAHMHIQRSDRHRPIVIYTVCLKKKHPRHF